VFRTLPAFEPFQQAATAEASLVRVLSFLFHGLRTLAAQFFHTRTDRGEIIGSAGSGHVSSLKIGPELRWAQAVYGLVWAS
jgi:hypothetical protein